MTEASTSPAKAGKPRKERGSYVARAARDARIKALLQVLANGGSFDRAGHELGLQGNTLRMELRDYRRRLGLKTNFQCVAQAVHSGLVQVEGT